MDLESLEMMLVKIGVPVGKTKPQVRAIAHWVNMIRNTDGYATGNPKDMTSLEKLRDMGLIDMKWHEGDVIATLTPKGKELDKVFFQTGYYVRT